MANSTGSSNGATRSPSQQSESKKTSNSKYQDPIPPEDIFPLQQSLADLDLSRFPSELTTIENPFWLLWVPTPNNFKNPTKPCVKLLKRPTNPNWDKPDECMTFEDIHNVYQQRMVHYHKALEALKRNPRTKVPIPVGFGFKYTDEHPFICVDIDSATDENNELIDLLESYTEWSPSGKGLHTIIRTESLLEKQHIINMFAKGKRNEKLGRDLFIASGYVTVTGKLIPIAPAEVRTVPTDDLAELFERFFLPNQKIISHPTKIQQQEEEAEALNKFRELAEQSAKDRDESTNKDTAPEPSDTTTTKKHAPLTVTQVKNLLNQIPVQCLEDDVFERLYNDEYAVIDLECTDEARTPWLIVGQAIHHNFKGRLDGYYLWDSWSKGGNKYDQDACEATWNSFKTKEAGQKHVTIAALIKLANAQRPQFPDRNGKGILKGTLNNFHCYIDFYKFRPYHNEITKDNKIEVPKEIAKRWRVDALSSGQELSLGEICEFMISDFIAMGFPPSSYSAQRIKRFLTGMCKTKSWNPIREYFEECGQHWDGNDYIEKLLETLEIRPLDMQYKPAYLQFIRKWLLQVAAAACHPANRPARLNRVLIFSGPQNAGKTKWVESLFPIELRKYCAADKEIRLSNFRSDNVKQTMELSNTLICNINEIDRLFKQSSFSDFKAFLDQTTDRIVLPYADAATEVTRRTVFIGSTNLETFLKDVTGNRRFEIIYAERLNFAHGLDIRQLWGQIYNLYKSGEVWWFDDSKQEDRKIIKMRDEINSRSMFIGEDAFIEQLEYLFDVDVAKEANDWKLMTFKDVRTLLGIEHLTTNSRAFNHAKRALHLWSEQMSGKGPVKGQGRNPRVYYHMPPIRETEDPIPPQPEEDTKPEDKKAVMDAIKQQMHELQKQLKQLQGE